MLVAELLTFYWYTPPFFCDFSLKFKVLSIFENQESQNVCVSYHMVTEHNPSNDFIPISAL